MMDFRQKSLGGLSLAAGAPGGMGADPWSLQQPDGAAPYPGLYGLQVFLVEDEAMVAMLLEDMLADFGCTIAGSAGTLSSAMSSVEALSAIDAAILDVNLGGEFIFPVADVLSERGVPFVFSTAYGTPELTKRYPQSLLLQKPYTPQALAEALTSFLRTVH